MSINSINLDAKNIAAGSTNSVADSNAVNAVEKTKVTTNTDKKATTTSTGTTEMLIDEIEEANHKLQIKNRRCEFHYEDDINRVSIKVIDKDTDEVIKEIPSEETLEMIRKLREMTGLLIDEQL